MNMMSSSDFEYEQRRFHDIKISMNAYVSKIMSMIGFYSLLNSGWNHLQSSNCPFGDAYKKV